MLNTAAGKIRPDAAALLVKGILCNVLVCAAAVWLAYAGRTVTDKILAVVLPVSAFIAAGFEHCVANMYFLPLAWFLVRMGHVPAGFDASPITLAGIVHNVLLATAWAGPAWCRGCLLGDLSGGVRRAVSGREVTGSGLENRGGI